VEAPSAIWDVDPYAYTLEALEVIFEVSGRLRRTLPGGRSDTLLTKTMVGVFGCVAAFDRFFRTGLHVSGFGRKSLATIMAFNAAHSDVIARYRVSTLGFTPGEETGRRYTRAKVIRHGVLHRRCLARGGFLSNGVVVG
jgi:hypothetical protein